MARILHWTEVIMHALNQNKYDEYHVVILHYLQSNKQMKEKVLFKCQVI